MATAPARWCCTAGCGRRWRRATTTPHFDVLIGEVLAAYADLARRFDVIVIEGAGSVSELNLRAHDLVNLGLVDPARRAVGAGRGHRARRRDRLGGWERWRCSRRTSGALFRGFLINKFRGDRTLFDEGRAFLEQHTGAPCLGVFPFAEDVARRRRGQPGRRSPPRRAAPDGRGHRHRAVAADVERHRLPAARLGGLADGAAAGRSPLRLRGAARHQGHARRSRLAASGRASPLGACPARRRRHDRGRLRRLPDARRDDRRSRGVESTGGAAAGSACCRCGPCSRRRSARAWCGRRRPAGHRARPTRSTWASRRCRPASRRSRCSTTVRTTGPAPLARSAPTCTAPSRTRAVCAEVFGVAVAPAASKAAEHDALARWFTASAERPESWLL